MMYDMQIVTRELQTCSDHSSSAFELQESLLKKRQHVGKTAQEEEELCTENMSFIQKLQLNL